MESKNLSLINVISLGIGSIVGAGIFALLGQVIILAGQHTYYAFIIAGTAAMFSGYSYSKLAAKYPVAGGLTNYFHIAFPEHWISGTLSLIYMLTSAISISMMAKSFGIYATEFFDQIPPSTLWVNSFACGLIIILSILNMLGASDVGKSETLLVFIKVAILIILIIGAFAHPELKLSPAKIPFSNWNFLQAVGITFFAYAGYGVITNAAANVKNPKFTISFAIYATLAIVITLYICLAHVVLNYTPHTDLLTNAETSVATVSAKILGKWGYDLIYVAAVFAFITGINATFFSIFRISKSLGQQKILPHFYVLKLWKQGTFGNAFTTILIIAATLAFDFSSIVNLSSAAFLVSYLGIFAANWKLRRETASSAPVILTGTALMLFILVTFIISLM